MAKKPFKAKPVEDSDNRMVYSTNPNFAFAALADLLNQDDANTAHQLLEVHLEKKHRGGKAVVIIKKYEGDAEALCKKLKTALGVGGSVKEGEIIIQGEKREKVIELLSGLGHKTKRVGG